MEENKFITFLSKHWQSLVYTVLILSCAGIWGERLFRRQHGNSKQDYLVANQIFERYRSGHPIALESLEVAEKIVSKHPELHAKYDTMLSHCCLLQNTPEKALDYATQAIKRTETQLPAFYVSFSETTLEIARSNYDFAYEQASALEEHLQQDTGYEQLRAFNLLRLVFLSEKIDKGSERLAFLETLQQLPTYSSIAALFHEGQLSLSTFLER